MTSLLRGLAVVMAVAVVGSTAAEAASPPPLPELAGEWTSDCLPIGKGGRHGFIMRLTITARTLEAVAQLYASNACRGPTVQARYASTGLSLRAEGDHLALDHQVYAITLTPNQPAVTAQYNAAGPDGAGCGLSGWETNRAKSVAGQRCDAFHYPQKGRHLFDGAWVSGDSLRFGAFPLAWTDTTPDERPKVPNDVVFHRTGY